VKSTPFPIRKLPGTRYARILTYPIEDAGELRKRINEASSLGVAALVFQGSTFLDGIPILGKGCVGIVTVGVLDGNSVAIKVRRVDADRLSMLEEARLLRLANSVDVGPRLVTATKNLLVMELFQGLPLYRWVESENLTPSKIKHVLRRLLSDCFRLDSVGLDHGELSHAPKNVLVNAHGEPCIVDFETASAVRRPANVTSLLQYFIFGKIASRIRSEQRFPDKRTIVKLLSQYKQGFRTETFHQILRTLNLT